MNENINFLKSCEREIVKIRELVLKDDEYTGGLLGDAVGSPVGVTHCVEARMKQIADLKAALAAARLREAGLREALKQFIEIDASCFGYSGMGLADFTETCAYVGRKPMELALEQAAALAAGSEGA